MTHIEAIKSIYKRFEELGIIKEEEPSDIKDALKHCYKLLLKEEEKL